MEKVYMVCDYTDEKAASISGGPNVGIEYMGNCCGRILREDGSVIGQHTSSSFGCLRLDLRGKLDDPSKYEIVDLIGQTVPSDRQDKKAKKDSGCYCVDGGSNFQLRTWDNVAQQYNKQKHPDTIEKYDKFWGFKPEEKKENKTNT